MQNENTNALLGPMIDRDLAVSVGQQIRAQLIHEIACGRLRAGAPVPSVRELAESLGVAPVTVAKVYSELKAEGLVEAQVGSGTFVADSPLSRAGADRRIGSLLEELDGLVDRAMSAGLGATDVMTILNARAIHRLATATGPRVFMVGLFEAATLSYAQRLTEQLGREVSVTPLVLGADSPEVDSTAAESLRGADLIVTFASLRERIGRIAPNRPVVAVRFIPAETTRLALAAIDPMARMVVVSRFADFLPVLELGVRRFAPHVQNVIAIDMDDPGLTALVASCDVLVLSTGAEAVSDLAPAAAVRIEYRHMPDPGDVERAVRPHLLSAAVPAAADPLHANKEAS